MPSYADICQLMLSYAELCWVMLSYAELCQRMPCVEDNSQCVNKMTAFILSFHIFWEDEKILFPSDFHSHSNDSKLLYICDHQKRSSYQSNHNSRIAFDILSAFAIIQKEKTLISYRLRYLTIWPSFPSSLTLAMMETKRRQLWRDKRLSGCHV